MSKNDWLKLGLKQAGITPEELGETVREAFDQNRQLLQAVKLETKVIDGLPVTKESPDNAARQKAIDSIYGIAGIRDQRAEHLGSGGPSVTIHIPDYYSREFLEQEGTLIDVDSSDTDDTTPSGS